MRSLTSMVFSPGKIMCKISLWIVFGLRQAVKRHLYAWENGPV
jgi:hypothetical protein